MHEPVHHTNASVTHNEMLQELDGKALVVVTNNYLSTHRFVHGVG